MAAVSTQIVNVIGSSIIYVLIIVNIPLIVVQGINNLLPFLFNIITMALGNSGYGRIVLFIIKISFLINLIITALLFYFVTWEFLLKSF